MHLTFPWRGFQKGPIKLNPKPGAATLGMIAIPRGLNKAPSLATANAEHVGASKWIPRPHMNASVTSQSNASVTSQRQRKIPSCTRQRPAPKKLEKEYVASIADLDSKDVDAKALQTWIKIVAHGLCAHEVGGGKAQLQHLPAIQQSAKFSFGAEFKRKHTTTHGLFKRLFREEGSAWQQAEASEAATAVINNLEDCRKFLLRVRRLPLVAGVATSFLNHSDSSTGVSGSGKEAAGVGILSGQGLWPKRQRCV